MALYYRHSSFFRQSVRGVPCRHPVDGGCDPDRWAGVYDWLDTLSVGSLAGRAALVPRAVLLNGDVAGLREELVELDKLNSRVVSRPCCSASASHAIALGRTAGCFLSADRPPTSLGVHEGPFKALAFFAELQTVFLDPAIDFPP